MKNSVETVYVWASAHEDTRDKGVVVIVMARENEKLVLIDLIDDKSTIRATLEGLDCILRDVLNLISIHPRYEKSTVHMYFDSNPLLKVQQQQEAIQRYCKLNVTWECRVAGMPGQAGVSVNGEIRRAAWKAFTETIAKERLLYRSCKALRLHRAGKEDVMDTLLRGMDITNTKPSNAMIDIAVLSGALIHVT